MTSYKKLATVGLLLTSFSTVENTFAKDAMAPITVPEAKNDWEVTGAAGLTLADGNADTLAYSLQLLATRITDIDEIYLDADYFYADDRGLETANALRLNAQYNRFLTEKFYYGFTGSYLADQVAELDFRIDTNALFGYYVWKNERSFLAFEAGPGYTWEDQGGIADSYASLRFAERFEYRFSNRSKFWQSVIFTPQVDDFDNHLIIAEAGIDTLITNQWSVRTFVRHRIDNTPALGREEGDTSVLVGLAYSLSGFPEPAAAGRRTLKADRGPSPIAAMGWSSSAAIGYSLASGNADSNTTTAMFDSAYRSASDEFFVSAVANYAQNDGATSIDNMRANVQYNHLYGTRYFAGVGTGFQRDDLADLAYRFTPAVVGGVYLVKNDVSTLSLEAGPGYTFEEVGGVTDDFLSIQGAQRFAYALSPRCTFNQNLIYNAEASDTDNFVLTANAFLDTDITDNLTLRVAASYLYDNIPALNRERHDTTFTTGFAIKF
jgi:putative salt-induced outer membrane protein YdiY